MANNIHIKSVEDGGNLLMYAKPSVLKEKKETTFKIHNHVKSDNPIKIKFYLLDEKGETGKEIPGFCTEMGSDTVLTIDKNDKSDCTTPSTVDKKYFAYTVENVDAETLDPVIIIEDAFDAAGGGGFPFSFMALLIPGVIGIVLGAAGYGFLKSRNNAAS